MRDVYVIGVGMIRFRKYPDVWVEELGRRVILEALSDAGVDPRRLQTAYCSHSHQGRVAGQRALKQAGIAGIEVRQRGKCVRRGIHLLPSGLSGGRKRALRHRPGRGHGERRVGGLLPPNPEDLDGLQGRVLPGHYAMKAIRHMHEYGTTAEQMAHGVGQEPQERLHEPLGPVPGTRHTGAGAQL